MLRGEKTQVTFQDIDIPERVGQCLQNMVLCRIGDRGIRIEKYDRNS